VEEGEAAGDARVNVGGGVAGGEGSTARSLRGPGLYTPTGGGGGPEAPEPGGRSGAVHTMRLRSSSPRFQRPRDPEARVPACLPGTNGQSYMWDPLRAAKWWTGCFQASVLYTYTQHCTRVKSSAPHTWLFFPCYVLVKFYLLLSGAATGLTKTSSLMDRG
jgi:hypothetical protein